MLAPTVDGGVHEERPGERPRRASDEQLALFRRPGEIAAGSGQSKQATNYLLGQLERLGYLERGDDPDDRRSKRVYLTPRGIEAATVMRESVAEVEGEWAAELGSSDFEQLRSLLGRLAGILSAR